MWVRLTFMVDKGRLGIVEFRSSVVGTRYASRLNRKQQSCNKSTATLTLYTPVSKINRPK